MMMGGMDGARRLMERDVIKPKNTLATLARFGRYLSKRWIGLVVVAVLMVIVTWTQVLGPDLIGQAVDCYLFQENPFASLSAASGQNSDASAVSTRNCWFDGQDYSKLTDEAA